MAGHPPGLQSSGNISDRGVCGGMESWMAAAKNADDRDAAAGSGGGRAGARVCGAAACAEAPDAGAGAYCYGRVQPFAARGYAASRAFGESGASILAAL